MGSDEHTEGTRKHNRPESNRTDRWATAAGVKFTADEERGRAGEKQLSKWFIHFVRRKQREKPLPARVAWLVDLVSRPTERRSFQ